MRQLRNFVSILALAVLLSACVAGLTRPDQRVFQAKTDYAVALTVAVAYRRLPPCPTATQICSDKAVVAQLQKADRVASAALDAAETVVRTPGFGASSIDGAITAANAALAAMVSITSTLKVK